MDLLSPHRRWRHQPWGRTPVFLECPIWRVRCPACGLRVEAVPWAEDSRTGFTKPFSELVAFLAQRMSHTAVAETLGIHWRTVGALARRVVQEILPLDRFRNLRRIGVDEFCWSHPKGFLTVVWDHDRRRVVWVGEGKAEATLQGFFEQIGPSRAARIKIVTGDLSGAYIAAIRSHLPKARFIADPFHILKLAHDALDQVRRGVVHDLRSLDEEEARAIKNTRYLLLRDGTELVPEDVCRINEIGRVCRPLHRGWTLKEMLAFVLSRRTVTVATWALGKLLKSLARSRLAQFVRLGRTLRKHAKAILASIEYRLTNGPVEGCNRKIRGLIYRAFGYRSQDNLVAAIELNCGGVNVKNPFAW